jgi:hypothetical protein
MLDFNEQINSHNSKDGWAQDTAEQHETSQLSYMHSLYIWEVQSLILS